MARIRLDAYGYIHLNLFENHSIPALGQYIGKNCYSIFIIKN